MTSEEIPPPPAIDVSGYVRRARRLADLSQRDLATRVGMAQPTVARVEGGDDLGVRALERILATAGLRLAVVDTAGEAVAPMPADGFRDRAGRRLPAHLDEHAKPENATIAMLLHDCEPLDGRESWHHRRAERDRLRRRATPASR